MGAKLDIYPPLQFSLIIRLKENVLHILFRLVCCSRRGIYNPSYCHTCQPSRFPERLRFFISLPQFPPLGSQSSCISSNLRHIFTPFPFLIITTCFWLWTEGRFLFRGSSSSSVTETWERERKLIKNALWLFCILSWELRGKIRRILSSARYSVTLILQKSQEYKI